jgi:threonine dehydrogenase-like Zn-dependent dehydrogenase
MRALVMGEHGVRLESRADPVPGRNDSVIEVSLAGICATDLEIARGYMGYRGVLGHEILGRAIDGPLAGARVVAEINCACRICPVCKRGEPQHCPNRTVLGILGKDGGLADRVAVPIANLHRIPDAIPDESAIFVEPLAAALHAFDEAPPKPGDRVLLIGDGKLGLLIGLVLARMRSGLGEARVIGRHPSKLALLEAAGLTVGLAKDFAGRDYDLAIEATGQVEGLALALRSVRPRGTIVLKSTYAGTPSIDLAPAVIHEIRIVGSRCGNFAHAISELSSGLDPRPLISARLPLSAGEHAFARAAEPGVLKVLVAPDTAPSGKRLA